MAYVAGYSNPVRYDPTGATAEQTLNITGWTASEEVQRLITTHSGSAGLQDCIRGVYDLTGNVTANYDAAARPHATPEIKAGNTGTISFATGTAGTDEFVVGVLITKVNYASAVNGLVTYNFDVALAHSVVASVTYPA
jgi:hypothetical protein